MPAYLLDSNALSDILKNPGGRTDMLIAAHALALGAVLVTDNTREFRRVKGLRVENWLRA